MTRFTDSNPLVGSSNEEERLKRVEEQIRLMENSLFNTFLRGRLRTDRAAPTTSADVTGPDQVYDFVINANYIYVLINNAGTLAWRRTALVAF